MSVYLAFASGAITHAPHGSPHTPRVGRLCPFLRLVNWDGVLTLLPEGNCPWVASVQGDAGVLLHQTVVADLDELKLDAFASQELTPRTRLAPQVRMQLETHLRDTFTGDWNLHDACTEMAVLQAECHMPALEFAPQDVLLDLLRCAGDPPELSNANRRLLLAVLPALRVIWSTWFPMPALPAALRAFALWLRATAELSQRDFTGEDILHFANTSLPLVTVLTYAGCTLPKDAQLPAGWASLAAHAGKPLGEALTYVMRHLQDGAVAELTNLGATFPFEVLCE